ncbi:N-acylethanolamine-hydrolyzing acid amidase [Thecamonas trahens ATCC 50062]|uniref:N-acylethanolamine-hydrolyzing acid amidase n=1 Tax=Thecamonas trahens ATCC 50062 TaxID=461836 RepID=A0A0L0D5S1_THETB|nr:N-acylethanolamine-hydrolyzing acid amidase [Thecamonas trahens ATCC 50062]KNC46648.1 N-acylethanolamine-hydrolyzing acid amidase [Thecamonas trahens ATCC 50062]|eukprot:XP_013760421.1 N-acylethanolamine-hydrolyzing acid amidase [Thecamonas trahens ATCC 50062]
MPAKATGFAGLPAGNVTTFTIDLDSPPEDHFKAVTEAYKEQIGALLAFIAQAIPSKYVPLAEKVAADVEFVFGAEVAGELRGMAATSGYSLGEITLLNVLYELTAYCTSIVTKTADGRLVHARNLDYGLSPALANVTYHAVFVRGNTTVFEATTFAGFAGVLTGMSKTISVTVDERDQGFPWENAFAALFEGGKAVTFLIRELLESASPVAYDAAVTTLSRTPLIAPSYVIVGGGTENDGTIIARNRYDAAGYLELQPLSATPWIVVTNYDMWKPDNPKDPRRTYALEHLSAIGAAHLTPMALLDVIATPPVLNHKTVYSIVACVGTQEYVSYLRA